MGVLGGDMQTLWLKQVAGVLQAQASLCVSAVPSWIACSGVESLLRFVAAQLLDGQLNSAVLAHNDLHQLMAQRGSAASLLGISPRLQHNTRAPEAVRISFDHMHRASLASVVVLATELIMKWDRPALPVLRSPEVLWMEVEGIAAHVRAADGEERMEHREKLPATSPTWKAASSSAASPGNASGGTPHTHIQEAPALGNRQRRCFYGEPDRPAEAGIFRDSLAFRRQAGGGRVCMQKGAFLRFGLQGVVHPWGGAPRTALAP